MNSRFTELRIFFRDEEIPEMVLPLERDGSSEFYSLGSERQLALPNGETIEVYAEANLAGSTPDVSVSVIQGGRDLDIRCGYGVIVSYETVEHFDVLLQIGTGAWE